MSHGVPERGAHPWTPDDPAGRPLIRQAVELGINFFDTANAHSDGTSDEVAALEAPYLPHAVVGFEQARDSPRRESRRLR